MTDTGGSAGPAAAAATPAATTAAPRPGLRERKKQRTRDALLRAALELFVAQGYEHTTVDEIAEAVDVSQRTFFRYFAGKEDAALFLQRLSESHFIDAVRERPPHEAPLEALRRAVLESWDTIGEAIEAVVPIELHMRTYQLIESTPALLAAHLRRSEEIEEEIARLIAEREGLDVDADPRPRIAVAVFGGVMRVTGRRWGAGEDTSVAAIRALTASYLDHVGPALAEKWDTRPDRPSVEPPEPSAGP
ncbi:TetR/AcrR family transcriptional regulator [Streptomyces sp. NPDC057094]|uniref:TetR/AcrR family transcriptional regulator n=1 Tax=Streptomyces sp. NPDC057094 TaxID=3346018 RepID=UPI003629CB19